MKKQKDYIKADFLHLEMYIDQLLQWKKTDICDCDIKLG